MELVWDLRCQSSLMSHDTGQPSISLDLHPSVEVVVVAHTNGQLVMHSTLDGKVINVIRPPTTRQHHSLTCLRWGKYVYVDLVSCQLKLHIYVSLSVTLPLK